MMATVAILGILAGLAAFALGTATRKARTSGQKFDIINLVQVARSRAQSTGSDVYVVFTNLDSRDSATRDVAPRVLVYEDAARALRGSSDLMTAIAADERNIREDLTGAGSFFGESGLAFVGRDPAAAIPPCPVAKLPAYIPVTNGRLDFHECEAWCTFCEVQGGRCTGALRFTSDGLGRIVTGPGNGTGGVLRLVDAADPSQAACLAFGEPSGAVVAIE